MVAPLWTQRFTSALNDPSAVRTTMIGVSPTAGEGVVGPRRLDLKAKKVPSRSAEHQILLPTVNLWIAEHLHRHVGEALPGPPQHLLHRPRCDCLSHLQALVN